MSLSSLSVIELSNKLKKGEIKSEELVKSYIEQINKTKELVKRILPILCSKEFEKVEMLRYFHFSQSCDNYNLRR